MLNGLTYLKYGTDHVNHESLSVGPHLKTDLGFAGIVVNLLDGTYVSAKVDRFRLTAQSTADEFISLGQ
jgi:hypothetical protein